MEVVRAMEKRCDLHALIADVVVLADSAVLLVRPHDPPDRPGWRLPGEPLRHGEHPQACAARVLQDQLGLAPDWLELAEVESLPGEPWHLFFHYKCEAAQAPAPGPAIAEARFFQIEHLPDTARGPWEREVIYRVLTGAPPG